MTALIHMAHICAWFYIVLIGSTLLFIIGSVGWVALCVLQWIFTSLLREQQIRNIKWLIALSAVGLMGCKTSLSQKENPEQFRTCSGSFCAATISGWDLHPQSSPAHLREAPPILGSLKASSDRMAISGQMPATISSWGSTAITNTPICR